MADTKGKNTSIPDVPEAMMVPSLTPPEMKFEPTMAFQPMSQTDIVGGWGDMMEAQQAWFPYMLRNQLIAQDRLYSQMGELQREQAPQFAQTAWDMMQQYAPGFQQSYDLLGQQLRAQLAAGGGVPKEFQDVYSQLGGRISEGLTAGYSLGDELTREVEQGIRASQTARGNYLGPALTAEEVMGKGSAALNMYNTRLGQAQSYLQGRNPSDMAAQTQGMMQNYLQGRNPADMMGQMAGNFMGQTYYPQTTYLDPQLSMQAPQLEQQGRMSFNATQQQAFASYNSTLNSATQAYNSNLIGATNANNEAQYNSYDRNFEQFLFNQAGAAGMYGQPGAGTAGGGMGVAGAAIGGVATVAAAAAPALIAL